MTAPKTSKEKETYSAAELDSLIFSTAKGDTEAFEALYNATNISVYSFALSIVRNAYDAEDVMQDCYAALFTSASGYASCGKPLAWILTIVRNLCFQKLRLRKLKAELPPQDDDALFCEKEDIPVEDKFIIRECLTALQDEERQIIILHAVSGFKHRETAEMLGLPLATVLSKYRRALKKLEKRLKMQ